jgi:lysophospholipase L1-like esterase
LLTADIIIIIIIMPLQLAHTILLFGDSITEQGYGVDDGTPGGVSLLANSYIRRAEVFNRGYSGYTTRHALKILPDLLPLPENMLFCTVNLGCNDAALPGSLQHVPIRDFEANLLKIVSEIRNNSNEGDFPIILMTPPPLHAERWRQVFNDPEPNRTNATSREYGDAVKRVGAIENNCHVLDVFSLLGGEGDEDEYSKHLRDGLHLSGSGNVLLFEGLLSLVQKKYPKLAPMEDGEGKYGAAGIPVEGMVWSDICSEK